MFLSLCTICFADVKNEAITQRVSDLEKAQTTDNQYLQKLQQEINAVTQRIIARNGAIQELKYLLSVPIEDVKFEEPKETDKKENK